MAEEPQQQPTVVEISGTVEIGVPADLEAGVYANFLAVWHTGHEITLDFAVTQPPQPAESEAGEPAVTLPARLVSRVKLPPTVVRDVIAVLEQHLARFERGSAILASEEARTEEAG